MQLFCQTLPSDLVFKLPIIESNFTASLRQAIQAPGAIATLGQDRLSFINTSSKPVWAGPLNPAQPLSSFTALDAQCAEPVRMITKLALTVPEESLLGVAQNCR